MLKSLIIQTETKKKHIIVGENMENLLLNKHYGSIIHFSNNKRSQSLMKKTEDDEIMEFTSLANNPTVWPTMSNICTNNEDWFDADAKPNS